MLYEFWQVCMLHIVDYIFMLHGPLYIHSPMSPKAIHRVHGPIKCEGHLVHSDRTMKRIVCARYCEAMSCKRNLIWMSWAHLLADSNNISYMVWAHLLAAINNIFYMGWAHPLRKESCIQVAWVHPLVARSHIFCIAWPMRYQ
jgi:hypothetical protein